MRNSKMRNRQHLLRKQTEKQAFRYKRQTKLSRNKCEYEIFQKQMDEKTSLQADNPKDSFPIDINMICNNIILCFLYLFDIKKQ